MKLGRNAITKLKVLKAELDYLQGLGFGGTELAIANSDWSSTAAALRPEVILHTRALSRSSDNVGIRELEWFTVVEIPRSFKLSLTILDDLLNQQADNSVVDALELLGQRASPLPEHQRNAVTKALRTVRNNLKP